MVADQTTVKMAAIRGGLDGDPLVRRETPLWSSEQPSQSAGDETWPDSSRYYKFMKINNRIGITISGGIIIFNQPMLYWRVLRKLWPLHVPSDSLKWLAKGRYTNYVLHFIPGAWVGTRWPGNIRSILFIFYLFSGIKKLHFWMKPFSPLKNQNVYFYFCIIFFVLSQCNPAGPTECCSKVEAGCSCWLWRWRWREDEEDRSVTDYCSSILPPASQVWSSSANNSRRHAIKSLPPLRVLFTKQNVKKIYNAGLASVFVFLYTPPPH